MKIKNRFCKICAENVSWIIGNQVPQKKDIYYITCEKGHIIEVLISKNLIKALSKE